MKRQIAVVLVLGMLVSGAVFGERWSAEKARAWYDRQPWLVGCNYLPGNAINSIEMWQASTFDPETIEDELELAEWLGFNTLRVYLHDRVWRHDSKRYCHRIDKFLRICQKHGIRPMFVFFDDCHFSEPKIGDQPDPIPGVHNSGWKQSPGERLVLAFADGSISDQERASLKGFVQGVLQRFGDDDRILMWDLYNEPGRRQLKNRSIPLLKATWRWAWEVRPSQPLTACVHGAVGKKIQEINRRNSDIITFHNYGPLKRVKAIVANLREARGQDAPFICTEYMARTKGSTFQAILPWFKQEKIGAINWGFVAGKSNTIWPWSSRTSRRGPRETNPTVPPEEAPPEPETWFHDIFRPDHTPYRQEEVELIRRLTGAAEG